MEEKLVIQGTLPSLNDYTRACRAHRMAGATMKEKAEELVSLSIPRVSLPGRVRIHCDWYEPTARRDPDNVRFGIKFISDALVRAGVIENDSQRFIAGLSDGFYTDKANPRIEVTITQVGG